MTATAAAVTAMDVSEAQELTQRLVRIDSSDPGNYEGSIEKQIHDWLRRQIDSCAGSLKGSIVLEESEVLPGRRNIRARIPARTPEGDRAAGLIYISHMDTVTLGEGWDPETPPLGAVIRDGRLYGRGACDMKSGLACALLAFRDVLRQVGQAGCLPSRAFSFIGSVDEEDFMRGSERAIADGWVKKNDYLLDTEPTDGQIRIAHKGRTWFELTMTGVTAHASTPWEGADAIAGIAAAITDIRQSIMNCPPHSELGISTVTFGQIEGGYRPYVVPDKAKVWIDMRLVPPTDTAAAIAIVQRAIGRAEEQVPGVRGSYTITGDRPYIERDPASPFIRLFKAVSDKTANMQTEIDVFNGYTDTAVISGKLHDANICSYGPGSLEMAHKPNEYVPLKDIDRCAAVLSAFARKWAEN